MLIEKQVDVPHTGRYQSYEITAETLLAMEINEIPWLVDGLIPRYGLTAVAGSSDTGKSSFLRQLALGVSSGDNTFLGFKLSPIHKSVIYVSTEDDEHAMSYLIGKQKKEGVTVLNPNRLRFIFESENIVSKLEAALKANPVDVIIVDAFTDLYSGDMNSSNQVRTYLNTFRDMANTYKCAVIFLHHTGKRTEALAPSKDNLLGSQGFEGKMRTVLELRKDHNNSDIRHLCILKGNYIKAEEKQSSFVLKFQEMVFKRLKQRVPFEELVKPSHKNVITDDVKQEVLRLNTAEGKSVREIEKILNDQGVKISKSTISNILNSCPTVQHPRDLSIGHPENVPIVPINTAA